MGIFSEMNIADPSVSADTERLADLAEQRDEQRQEAEAAQAQELLQQMQSAEQAEKKETPPEPTEEEKRRAHEEAEAKRRAEWEAKKRAREEAEQAAWENAVAMDDDQLLQASVKRLGDDAERITRRNMKQCVTEYIQTHCYEDMDFARQVMHPRKSMIHCFRYINRKARDFVKQEMEDNDEKPTGDGYGCDVPDDLCYQWAVEYFMDMEAPEDKTEEDKEFVPKPYNGKPAPKPRKKTEKKKPAAKKEEPKETAETQMNIFDLGGAADEQACAS